MAAIVAFGLTACMDDYDDPQTETNDVTSPTDIGAVNYSIAQLKNDNKSLFNQTNAFEQVKTDRIIEGVVVANDEGGNLYQTLMLRHIDTTKEVGDPLRDQSIVLAVKNNLAHALLPPRTARQGKPQGPVHRCLLQTSQNRSALLHQQR